MASSSSIKLLEQSFEQLSRDAKDLYLPTTIKELTKPPSSLVFLREYVMSNIPVVIRGGVQDWPALKKWTDSYLKQVLGDRMVTVAMTPNGYADAPVDNKFVLPHEELMSMTTFLEILNRDDDEKHLNDVVYIQKQNSSFTDEFECLIPDACEEILWASEAFGASPDAINFWMGGSRSITSTHKDPYENLYAVVRGAKTFLLFPPVDLPFLPYEMFTTAQFKRKNDGSYDIVDVINEHCCGLCQLEKNVESEKGIILTGAPKNNNQLNGVTTKCDEDNGDQNGNKIVTGSDGLNSFIPSLDNSNCICECHAPNKVPWIAIDPLNPHPKHKDLFEKSNPLKVTVYPGDLLYLPSLWFHHVMQDDGTIAVNFWYDMTYDSKYVYFKFLENLSQPVLRNLNS